MSFLLRFFPGLTYIRLVTYIVLVVFLSGLLWKVYYIVDKRGYNRAVAEQLILQTKQTKLNRENARFVEIKYIERQTIVNRTITKIEKELPNATKNLNTCLLSDDAIKLLNDAKSTVNN